MKTVVIFGGAGFVGQNIIICLVRKGYRIIVPYQRINNEAKLRLLGNIGQVIPLKFNNIKELLIQKTIADSNVLLNLKTIWKEKKRSSFKNDIFNFNKQLIDSINLIDKTKPFIFFSGLGVSDKSLSKRTQCIAKVEKYIENNLENSSIIKPSVIVGHGDQFISKLLLIFKLSYFIPLFGGGNSKLQPVFVDDVGRGIVKIIEEGITGKKIYEFAGNEIFSYKDLYKYIANCLKIKRVFFTINFNITKFCVFILNKTPFNFLTYDQLLLFKKDNILSENNKKFSDLGLSPMDVREIIKKIIYIRK